MLLGEYLINILYTVIYVLIRCFFAVIFAVRVDLGGILARYLHYLAR